MIDKGVFFMPCPECAQGEVRPCVTRLGDVVWFCDEADETWLRAQDIGITDPIAVPCARGGSDGRSTCEILRYAVPAALSPEHRAIVLGHDAYQREVERRSRAFGWGRATNADPTSVGAVDATAPILLDGLAMRSVADVLDALWLPPCAAATPVGDLPDMLERLLATHVPSIDTEWLFAHVSRARFGAAFEVIVEAFARSERATLTTVAVE